MAKTPFSSGGGILLPSPDIVTTVDFTSATWNTIGQHQVLAVTGLNHIAFIVYCSTNLSSGPWISFGDNADPDSITSAIAAYNVHAGEIIAGNTVLEVMPATLNYNADSPSTNFPWCAVHNVIASDDIIYNVTTSAFTSGELEILAWFSPLRDGASVAAGSGA